MACLSPLQAEEWKALRRRFNPGFAPQHLMTLLPCILDKTWYFLEHLDGYARTGEAFCLDEFCTNLTFDIIGGSFRIPLLPLLTILVKN
jgi:cytochrome P450